MSALESIIKWAQNDLPDWKSDAVRRLLIQNELADKDEEDFLNMLKSSCGLVDEKKPVVKPKPLSIGDISGSYQAGRKITLKAIQDLYGVNAIPDGSRLPIGHKGLTVVYGENGTGKSGYARVLKKSCRARDTKDKILPNVFGKEEYGNSKAELKISINDGKDECICWEDGKEEETILSSISVFDSRCARIIIDEKNEATYLPYGAHVFEDLVKLMKNLRAKLKSEKVEPVKLEFLDIPKSTESGRFIDELSHETEDALIEEGTKWTKEDALSRLKKKIAKIEADDPKKEVKRIRNTKDRIQGILDHVNEIDIALSSSKADTIRRCKRRLDTAEKALEIASKETLKNEPLPGAGGNEWQMLYNTAKEYSLSAAYPDKDFPVIDEGSRCVLCMQPLLADGKKRILRFKKFMDETVKKERDDAKRQLQDDLNEIQELRFPQMESYQDLLDEIKTRDEELHILLIKYFPGMQNRGKIMIQSAKKKKDLELPKIEQSPKELLEKIISSLETEADKFEKSATPEELSKKKSKLEELSTAKLMADRKQKIIKYVNQLKKDRKYDDCIAQTRFHDITIQGKKIISAALTPRLREAFKKELEILNADYLPLKIEASGGEGETFHKIEIKECQTILKPNLSDILSEGEQKVVGIAGFLAELSTVDHECPIVLDDPVCSLDHKFRKKIADRLVATSAKRQVIIFTHDIEFLSELKKKAGESDDIYFYALTMLRDAECVGAIVEDLPWHTMSVNKRISYLFREMEKIRSLYESDLNEYNLKAGFLYNLLRETWESFIEQVLLYETISRYGSDIQTQRLKSVKITTEDYKKIHLGMGKCSTWMFGHDKSKSSDINRPRPDELQEDIKSLKTFTKEIRDRHKATRTEREKSLEPVIPEVG